MVTLRMVAFALHPQSRTVCTSLGLPAPGSVFCAQEADWGLLMGELLGDAVVMHCGNVRCTNLAGEAASLPP